MTKAVSIGLDEKDGEKVMLSLYEESGLFIIVTHDAQTAHYTPDGKISSFGFFCYGQEIGDGKIKKLIFKEKYVMVYDDNLLEKNSNKPRMFPYNKNFVLESNIFSVEKSSDFITINQQSPNPQDFLSSSLTFPQHIPLDKIQKLRSGSKEWRNFFDEVGIKGKTTHKK